MPQSVHDDDYIVSARDMNESHSKLSSISEFFKSCCAFTRIKNIGLEWEEQKKKDAVSRAQSGQEFTLHF